MNAEMAWISDQEYIWVNLPHMSSCLRKIEAVTTPCNARLSRSRPGSREDALFGCRPSDFCRLGRRFLS
jgi:hypothetical protein